MVALALMTFLVLLVVSLALLGQVETGVANAQRQTALARQNALFSLEMALAHLQHSAGPDQKVTARAEIDTGVSTTGGTRYWTGVWDSRSGAFDVDWLVSWDPDRMAGSKPDPAVGTSLSAGKPYDQSWVWMLGADVMSGGQDDAVVAPLAEMVGVDPSGNQFVEGRYAYWVGDEGVKANVNPMPTAGALIPALFDEQIGQQQSNPRAGFEINATSIDRDDLETFLAESHTLFSIRQLDTPLGIKGIDHSHHWTVYSEGLLTNPLDGGLKFNLDAAPLATHFGDDVFSLGRVTGTMDELLSLRNPDGVYRISELSVPEYDAIPPGDPYVFVQPLMTEGRIFITAFYYKLTKRSLDLRYYLKAEFWNPYSAPLLLSVGDTRPFVVNVTGLPTVWFEHTSNPGGAIITPEKDIDDMESSSVHLPVTSSWMVFNEDSEQYEGNALLRPGEVYALEDPDPWNQGFGLAKETGLYIGEDQNITDSSFVSFYGKPSSEGGVIWSFYRGSDIASVDLNAPVFQLGRVPYTEFRYALSPRAEHGFPFTVTNRTEVDIRDRYILSFHYRLKPRWDDEVDQLALIDNELRRPLFDYEGEENLFDTMNTNPLDGNISLSGNFFEQDFAWDAILRSSDWNGDDEEFGDSRIYDLPVQEAITVADFRLLPFKGYPPRALGSSGERSVGEVGDDLNMAFDRYFLSTLPPDSELPDPEAIPANSVLANSRMKLLRKNPNTGEASYASDELRSRDSAQYFTVKGAFNWNSTDVEAWKAMLANRFLEEWQYTDPETNRASREFPGLNLFFRNSHGASFMAEPWADEDFNPGDNSPTMRNQLFRQGFRALSDEQISALAEAIVDLLKQRGRPYGSLSEFISSGMFEQALEAASDSVNEPFMDFPASNAHLRQDDIVAQLVGSAAVRSDTFVIRAYGEVNDRYFDRVGGRAICEAVVQRTIDPLDDSINPNELESGEGPNRRFRIVSFRWVHPREIF